LMFNHIFVRRVVSVWSPSLMNSTCATLKLQW